MALLWPAEFLALFLGASAFLLSAGGSFHAWRWSRRTLTRPTRARAAVAPLHVPRAAVIVPCRGDHPGFEENVRALATQDYANYDLLFVVDAKDDPSAVALEAMRCRMPRFRVLLSDEGLVGAGWATGKIAAQLTGVAEAPSDCSVLVFADADARPGPGWLAALVGPLGDPEVGGVTGYRWYLPVGPPTFWTALRDAWNAVGLDALTMARLRFLWGGSMAVRRADFERSRVRELWQRMVSEDVALGMAVRDLGLKIEFAPHAMVASPEDWNRAEVLEWVVRQAGLTRAALPRIFVFAGVVYTLAVALAVLGVALVMAWPSMSWGLAGLLFLSPVLSAAPRAWWREHMARRVLPHAQRSAGGAVAQALLSVGLPVFMLWVLWKARSMRSIRWRGRTYALDLR